VGIESLKSTESLMSTSVLVRSIDARLEVVGIAPCGFLSQFDWVHSTGDVLTAYPHSQDSRGGRA
jgi:hypothetical protein